MMMHCGVYDWLLACVVCDKMVLIRDTNGGKTPIITWKKSVVIDFAIAFSNGEFPFSSTSKGKTQKLIIRSLANFQAHTLSPNTKNKQCKK